MKSRDYTHAAGVFDPFYRVFDPLYRFAPSPRSRVRENVEDLAQLM